MASENTAMNTPPTGVQPARGGSDVAPGTEAKRLALVEDDRLNAIILQRILERDGYQVTWFASGEEFLNAPGREAFDLVLLDVVLPGVDGLEVCRRLKASLGDSDVPVIFITARSGAKDVVAGFESGGADYIPKPFQPSEALARVRTHLRVRELLNEQAEIIAKLDAAVQARNRLLGVTAHDLRNPLISIRGFGEMLRDGMAGEMNAEQSEMASIIASAAASMLGLIDDLLDLSAIDAGELKLDLEESDLAELLDKTVSLYRGHADNKEISLQTDPPSEMVRACFDRGRMQQVAENLISNALKFSPRGLRVLVKWGESGDSVFFAVRDEGPGIPEAERDRLFMDYGKTSVRPTAGEKSTGLGLAICRKIVEAHGGVIEVTNLAGRGCEFVVTIPARLNEGETHKSE